ncbi:MAG: arylsulfatase A [Planctomycetota bacterium]|jgi:arylsulfatase A
MIDRPQAIGKVPTTAWLRILLLALLVACSSTKASGPDGFSRPNLIVVLADDLGVEALGCYGGESYATPNLDQLAHAGVLFENAFTQPLCTPTRVELLTGRSNARNYLSFSVLDPRERTFAHVLRDGGYRTFAIGKWQLFGADHYGPQIQAHGSLPEDAGFEHHALWQVEQLGLRHWEPTLTIDGLSTTFDPSAYGPDLALEHGLRWIDEAGDDPFLMYWPMILPHDPFLAPPGSEGPRKPPGDPLHFGPTVEYMDALVGRLVEHLEQRGLAENTMILFIGDNGTSPQIISKRAGSLIRGDKKRPTDAGSRVPFLAYAPGRWSQAKRVTDPVSTVDVFATLIDASGLQLPKDRPLDGWSLMPRLDGEVERHREWVNFHYHPRPVSRPNSKAQRWARDERWQLFEDGRLFDTDQDPGLEQAYGETQGETQSGAQVAARARLQRGLDSLPQPLVRETHQRTQR